MMMFREKGGFYDDVYGWCIPVREKQNFFTDVEKKNRKVPSKK